MDTRLKLQNLDDGEENSKKKQIEFQPKAKPPRREMKHFKPGISWRCGKEWNLGGIRTGINQIEYRKDFYYIEQNMGKKGRIGEFYDKRNGLSAYSLGDKPFRYPEYSSNFFKEGGLVTGSTIAYRPRVGALKNEVDFTENKNAKWPLYPRKLWKDRVKEEQRKEELDQLNQLDEWEETVLKEHKGETEQDEDDKENEKKGSKGRKPLKKGGRGRK